MPKKPGFVLAPNHRRRIKVGAAALASIGIAVAALVAGSTVASASTTTGIFPDDLTPTIHAASDTNSVELGVRFSPEQSGSVIALQYYQAPKDSGVTTATLWSSSGDALATASFAASETEGWRTASLTTPVELDPSESYVVSYLAPHGSYAVTQGALWQSTDTGDFSLPARAGVFHYGDSSVMPTSTYKGSNYMADIVFAPGGDPGSTPTPTPTPTATATHTPRPTPTPTVTPTPAPTVTPTPTPTPTPPPTTTPGSPSPAGSIYALGRAFPSPSTTGVPAGTALTPYTGPCAIQTPNVVIDAKTVDCDLRILAKGVVITRSQINGSVYADYTANQGSFTISDSQVNVGNWPGTGIGDARFTATRVHVTGGSRSINCYADCTVQDSYVADQYTDNTGVNHESGIRINTNSHLIHNTIGCTAPNVAPDAGCSAAITGYPDFDPVTGNVVDGNLILADSGGYCSYGGSTAGKPFSGQTSNIQFTNNIYQKGDSGQCGYWGAITSFDTRAPGNVWSNNLYDDGKAVPAAN